MTVEIRRISSSESALVIELYRIFYKQPSNIELAKTFIQTRLYKNESVIFVATIKDKNEVISLGFTQLYPKFSSGILQYAKLLTR